MSYLGSDIFVLYPLTGPMGRQDDVVSPKPAHLAF